MWFALNTQQFGLLVFMCRPAIVEHYSIVYFNPFSSWWTTGAISSGFLLEIILLQTSS